MNLTDLAPLDRWMALEEDIHARSGLDVNVFNPQGYRISEIKHWANGLCPEIKATDKGQSFICAPAHMNIAAMALKRRAAVVEECDAGMIKLVVPIFYEGRFVGAVGACGFLLDDGEIDAFLVNKTTDIAEEEVARLSQGIPAITTEKAEALGRCIAAHVGKILNVDDPRDSAKS